MPKIQHFDRAMCKAVGEAVQKALAPVAEEFGLTLTMKGGSFMASNYSPKIEFAIQGEGGIVMTREAEAFRANAPMYGMRSEHLGSEFAYGGRRYKIVGWSRGYKKPVLASTVEGKTYKFSPELVKMLVEKAERERGGQS